MSDINRPKQTETLGEVIWNTKGCWVRYKEPGKRGGGVLDLGHQADLPAIRATLRQREIKLARIVSKFY